MICKNNLTNNCMIYSARKTGMCPDHFKQDDKNALSIDNLALELKEECRILKRNATSYNTRKAHTTDLNYWRGWFEVMGYSFQESITSDHILRFILDHAHGLSAKIDRKLVEKGYKKKLGRFKTSTIKRHVASLSVYLSQEEKDNPCKKNVVRTALADITKMYGASSPSGRAITKDILLDMIDTCRKNRLIDIRDRALLLFAWGSGGRRRSEVTCALMENLIQNDHDFTYIITKSKTDQKGIGNPVPVKGRAAGALKEWIDAAGIKTGHIFRSISKSGKVRNPLSPIDVYRIVKRRLELAGYDKSNFVAHGLRSGFVTEAGKQGKPLGDVKQMTLHRSISTLMRYYHAGAIHKNSASDLIDD